MDNYIFGKCKYCGKDKVLKNDVCVDCAEKNDLPEFMKDLFGGFKNEKYPGISISHYTDENTELCKQLMLFKKEELIKILYIDMRYAIYLMSNEGKTIERIN